MNDDVLAINGFKRALFQTYHLLVNPFPCQQTKKLTNEQTFLTFENQ